MATSTAASVGSPTHRMVRRSASVHPDGAAARNRPSARRNPTEPHVVQQASSSTDATDAPSTVVTNVIGGVQPSIDKFVEYLKRKMQWVGEPGRVEAQRKDVQGTETYAAETQKQIPNNLKLWLPGLSPNWTHGEWRLLLGSSDAGLGKQVVTVTCKVRLNDLLHLYGLHIHNFSKRNLENLQDPIKKYTWEKLLPGQPKSSRVELSVANARKVGAFIYDKFGEPMTQVIDLFLQCLESTPKAPKLRCSVCKLVRKDGVDMRVHFQKGCALTGGRDTKGTEGPWAICVCGLGFYDREGFEGHVSLGKCERFKKYALLFEDSREK